MLTEWTKQNTKIDPVLHPLGKYISWSPTKEIARVHNRPHDPTNTCLEGDNYDDDDNNK